jgi:hypothetical protein
MGEVHICDICNNTMIVGDCIKCGGLGKAPFLFGLFRRTCPRCEGVKSTYRCTNYREHGILQNS